jgi:hypothetical protein
MGTLRTLRGGDAYVAPAIEQIEIATEKGFLGSNPGGGVQPMSYDSFYEEQ